MRLSFLCTKSSVPARRVSVRWNAALNRASGRVADHLRNPETVANHEERVADAAVPVSTLMQIWVLATGPTHNASTLLSRARVTSIAGTTGCQRGRRGPGA
jgi:hypothetical protein